jgi:hypothetical protein
VQLQFQGAIAVSTTQPIPESGDRRKNRDLVYPPRYEALRPFFDRRTQWGGSSGGQEVLAYRTLKDHFPELSAQEIFLTIITARQLFQSGGKAE